MSAETRAKQMDDVPVERIQEAIDTFDLTLTKHWQVRVLAHAATRLVGLLVSASPPDYMSAVYDQDGHLYPELLERVEAAIDRYPLRNAPHWLGGVAAIRAVVDWLNERLGAGY